MSFLLHVFADLNLGNFCLKFYIQRKSHGHYSLSSEYYIYETIKSFSRWVRLNAVPGIKLIDGSKSLIALMN